MAETGTGGEDRRGGQGVRTREEINGVENRTDSHRRARFRLRTSLNAILT